MDEMVISSQFTKTILNKILRKIIKDKIGINVNFLFKEPIRIKIEDEQITGEIGIVFEVPKSDVRTLINKYI